VGKTALNTVLAFAGSWAGSAMHGIVVCASIARIGVRPREVNQSPAMFGIARRRIFYGG